MITKIKNNYISATINSYGAELVQLTKDSKNYIWEVDSNYWNKTSPILFPIVGRLKKDVYHINEENYTMPRHGFARENEFTITEIGDAFVEYELVNTLEHKKQYPFNFALRLKYSLENTSLKLEYTVINLSDTDMPFSIGAHPAFAINCKQNSYSIHFDKNNFVITEELEQEIFNGKNSTLELKNNTLNLDYAYFTKDALVFKDITTRTLTIFENENPFLKIDLGNFPHLGIWTKENAPFLCIEPWFGYADSQNTNGNIFEKEGIQIIAPKQTFTCHFTIETL